MQYQSVVTVIQAKYISSFRPSIMATPVSWINDRPHSSLESNSTHAHTCKQSVLQNTTAVIISSSSVTASMCACF